MKKRGKKEIKVKKTRTDKTKSNHKNIYLIFFLIGLAGLIISIIKKNIIGIIINTIIILFSIIEEEISKKIKNYQKIEETNIHTLLLTLGLITGLFGYYKKDWLVVGLGGFIFLLSFAITRKKELPKEEPVNYRIETKKQIKIKKIKKERGFLNYYLLLILLIIINIFGLIKKEPMINLTSLFIAMIAIILLIKKIKIKKSNVTKKERKKPKVIKKEVNKSKIIKKQKRSPLLFFLFLIGCGLFYYSKIIHNQIIRLTSITLILLTIILFFIKRKKSKKQKFEEKKGPKNFIYFSISLVILIITTYYGYNLKWMPTLIGIYLFFFLILIYKIIQKRSTKVLETKKKKIPIIKEALYKTDIDSLLDLVEKNG